MVLCGAGYLCVRCDSWSEIGGSFLTIPFLMNGSAKCWQDSDHAWSDDTRYPNDAFN